MKAYPEYKDSGIEWVGKIPFEWNLMPIKYIGHIKGGAGFPHIEQGKKDEDINFFKVNALGTSDKNDFLSEMKNKNTISKETAKSLGAFIFPENSIVFAKVGAALLLSRIRWIIKPACIDNNMMGCTVNKKNNPLFIKYLFNLIKFDFIVNPGAIPSINESQINNYKLPIPCLSEQENISNFLEKKTYKINSLIDEKQIFIKLLKEKRQALISHVVTKGLNPDVKMKDSEIDWIGDIPEHWELRKFKHIFKIKKRIAGKLGFDILSITQKGIKIKDIKSGAGQVSSDYSKYQIVESGDFAMNHMDLLTGYVDLSKYDGVTSPDYRVFSLDDNESDKSYYLTILQLGYMDKLFYPLGRGAAHLGRWRLPSDAFKEFKAPYPPEKEQISISKFIVKENHRVENLINEVLNSIELLKEKRIALISAAVTGKIDVREEV